MNSLLVGIGGGIGAVLRYSFSIFTNHFFHSYFFLATLFVNLSGCFIIGILWGVSEKKEIFNNNVKLFIFTGILGGFTTFSTFSYESFLLLHTDLKLFFINIICNICLGIILVVAGNIASKKII